MSRSLKEVERDLSTSIVVAALVVLLFSFLCCYLVLKQYERYTKSTAENELSSALTIYTSNLMNRVAIIVGSSEFMEYVRSGRSTRTKLEKEFIELVGRIPTDEIVGISIFKNNSSTPILKLGDQTGSRLTIPLCFFGDRLYAKFGTCIGSVFFHLDLQNVVLKIQNVNPNIVSCNQCTPTELPEINDDIYSASYNFRVGLDVDTKPRLGYFYLTIAVLVFSLIAVAFWAARRIRKTISNEIITPLKEIVNGCVSENIENSTVEEIMEFRYRQDFLEAKTHAEAQQTRRLANEIHDMFGSNFVLLKWAIDRWKSNPTEEEVDNVLEKLDCLIDLSNDFIESLRPEVLDTLGLSGALRAAVYDWSHNNHRCKYEASIQMKTASLPEAIENAVYRITQEALTNAAKHSNASEVNVSLQEVDEKYPNLLLTISDNGRGFSSNLEVPFVAGGHGIAGMKGRAVALGGSFQIRSSIGKGTEVAVTIPLKHV